MLFQGGFDCVKISTLRSWKSTRIFLSGGPRSKLTSVLKQNDVEIVTNLLWLVFFWNLYGGEAS